ncbi:hypothetical protein P8Q88_11315 [Qipengyuania sp. XHP0207]|uniref:hypothetical protein n=1 Tax=Qipengyuania sp. XHP0207 TaxID=3038078 RepID=UPI00241FF231|nr:hypothetical protein [Qipengyuania sp. XHP0207]MDG5748762.1 hypothetical protein [Qipengyuania sp. XHP0207]
MSKNLPRELIADTAIVHDRLAPQRTVVDRTFELPRPLYVATVGLYLGFLAVMATGLSTPGLAIPMAIFAIFIVAGFGLPLVWTRLAPESGQRNLRWTELKRRGIATHTGRVNARDASVQVLILPVLIFCWGLTVVTIVGSVTG